MDSLNKDLILKISSLLTLREGLNFSLCNKRLFECIFGNKYYWINNLNKDFPNYYLGYNVRSIGNYNQIKYKYTYLNLSNEVRGNKKVIEKLNPNDLVFSSRQHNFNIGGMCSFHFNRNDAFYSVFLFLYFKIRYIEEGGSQQSMEEDYDLLNEKKGFIPDIEKFDCEKKLNETEIKWLKILMNKVKHLVYHDNEYEKKNPHSDFLEILVEYFLYDIIPFTITYGELLHIPIYQRNF